MVPYLFKGLLGLDDAFTIIWHIFILSLIHVINVFCVDTTKTTTKNFATSRNPTNIGKFWPVHFVVRLFD